MILSFINIRKVFAFGFQHFPCDLADVNEWKIMFDPSIGKKLLYRKIPKFSDTQNVAEMYLKFKQRHQILGNFIKKGANGIANSENPDQTAPLGVV